jgi:hypothetical protein
MAIYPLFGNDEPPLLGSNVLPTLEEVGQGKMERESAAQKQGAIKKTRGSGLTHGSLSISI